MAVFDRGKREKRDTRDIKDIRDKNRNDIVVILNIEIFRAKPCHQ